MVTVNSSLDGFAFVHLELHDAVGHVEHEVLQHLGVNLLPAPTNPPHELVHGLDLDLVNLISGQGFHDKWPTPSELFGYSGDVVLPRVPVQLLILL